MASAKNLALRIIELEAKLAAGQALVTQREQELGAAYGEADDAAVTKALAVLTSARDAVPAMVGALKKLDRIYYDQAMAEHKAAAEALSKETEANYKRVETSVRTSLVPLVKILKEFFPAPEATVENDIIAPAMASIWTLLDERASEKFRVDVPPPPKSLPVREKETGLLSEAYRG